MFHSGEGVFRVICNFSFVAHSALYLWPKKVHFGLLWPKHLIPNLWCRKHGKQDFLCLSFNTDFLLATLAQGRICGVQILMVVAWTDFATRAVDFCSSSRVTMGLSAAALTSALLIHPVSLGGQLCLGRFAAVPYFGTFWDDELNILFMRC